MTTLRSCDGGHTCSPPKECCKQGCCYLQESVVHRVGSLPPSNMFAMVVSHWYFWAATTATLLGILCACSLWRRQNSGSSVRSRGGSSCFFCCSPFGDAAGSRIGDEHVSEPDSDGSCYVPLQYSRCSSFQQPPPAYSEVTSKPDLYPLVISYNGDALLKANVGSTGYVMVQYFRNFIVRPAGTISATSTIDSLSSSFICNTANEANNIIPPPYSHMGSLEEVSVPANATNNVSSLASAVTAAQQTQSTSPPATELETSMPIVPSPASLISPVALVTNSSGQHAHTEVAEGDQTSAKQHCIASAMKKSETLRLTGKCKPSQQQSIESESDENNFSELLNLSVCAPSSLVASNAVIAQSNPQMEMILNSVTNSLTSSDISSLTNLGTPDSPPRATSPTLELRELLDKIQQLPGPHKGSTPVDAPKLKKYFNRSKAKTLYMPLAGATGGIKEEKRSRGWLSRSAPTTPCSNFMPNFSGVHHTHTFGVAASSIAAGKRSASHKCSKTKLSSFDDSPLLKEHAESDEDNERM